MISRFFPCPAITLINICKMKKIVYKLVYNRKHVLNCQGEALVQVEAYLERRKKYFSTHVYLKPEQWDARKRQVKRHPNAEALNRRLYAFVAAMEEKELQMWKQGRPVSLETLKAELQTGDSGDSFLAFFEREVRNAAVRESTRRNLWSTFNVLREFNTIAKHMKQLKRPVNAAVHKGYLPAQSHPFLHYKIKTTAYRHTRLNPEELARLERLVPDRRCPQLQHTLDAFLFCCYAGLRYSDFIRLTPENLISMRNEVWLVYRSEKTGIEVNLPLYLLFGGKALAILEEYRRNLPDFFQLKDNSNVNKVLRSMAQRAGLSKRISFHTARHTNATLLIYSGINITTVQKLLGHRSVKTTQIYANVMDRTIVHDLERHRERKEDV